jgi:hypothetical protein
MKATDFHVKQVKWVVRKHYVMREGLSKIGEL